MIEKEERKPPPAACGRMMAKERGEESRERFAEGERVPFKFFLLPVLLVGRLSQWSAQSLRGVRCGEWGVGRASERKGKDLMKRKRRSTETLTNET